MASDRPRPPDLPERTLSERGWTLLEERRETLATLPAARVEGATRVYEDGPLRRRLAAATGVDRTWRFAFAARVAFSPPLPPGVGTSVARPVVASEARRAFVDDLERRGVVDVDRGRSERLRTDADDRVRLRSYRGRLPVDGAALSVEGWVGVWSVDEEFRVAGGAYPTDLRSAVGEAVPVPDPGTCRSDLFEFVRTVS